MRKTLADIAYYVTDRIDYTELDERTYVGIDNMVPNRGGVTASEYVPSVGQYIAFRAGDILIGNIRPYFKKVWLASFDGGCSPDVLCVRAKDGVSSLFLYAVLSQDNFFDYDVRGSKGSKMPRGDKNHIMAYPVPEIQSKEEVGLIINSIYRKIQNNNAICADLDAMAKLLYDYWFVQFDFPDENGKPYKSTGGKMVCNDGLKREIPEGWDVCALNSKISLERGISYSSDNLVGGGIPMINLGCFAIGGGYKDGNLKSYNGDYPETKIIHPYDLILCLTQQTSIDPRKDVIGCSLLVPDVFLSDIVITQDMAKVVCSDELRYFLVQYINASYFHRYITGFASGSNILHLDVNGILRHITVIPPEGILKQYANLVKPMWEKRSECMSENRQLASLRDFLLPLLMNGQVTIQTANAEEDSEPKMLNNTWYDKRFALWLENQGLAARGNVDRATLREIFDAMDDDDK